MPRRSPRRCSRPSALGEPGAPEIPVTVVPLGGRFKRRAVRHRACVRSRIRSRNRTRSSSARRSARCCTPATGRSIRRRSSATPTDESEAARARRRGLPGADRRFHQCGARRPLAVGNRRRQDPRRTDRRTRAAASRSPPSPPTSRACARSPMPRAPPTARWWWSAAPWSASCRSRARPAISTACRISAALDVYGYLPPDKVVALCTGSQGEPRAALVAHRRGRASGGDAVARRPRDLFLAHHSRQREGGRPHHQRPDRPGHRGHHRPHPSGARLRPSAPRRAREHDRLGQAADPHSGARRGAASGRARRAGAAAAASRRSCSAATAIWCGWRRASPASSTRCRPGGSTRTARCWSRPRRAPSPTASG